MISPLERAARALYLRKPQTLDIFTEDMADPNKMRGFIKGDLTWEDLDEDERSAYIEAARAVLTAIRDFPNFNDPVTKAGSAVLSVGASPHWSKDHEAQKVWKAMIDAALKEG